MIRDEEFEVRADVRNYCTVIKIRAHLHWPTVWGTRGLLLQGQHSLADILAVNAQDPDLLQATIQNDLRLRVRELVADLQAWEIDQRGTD